MGRCDAILSHGIFDTVIFDLNMDVSENLFEWLKRSTFSEVKEKIDAGLKLSLPIKGVPFSLDGSFTEDDFNQWKEDIDQGKSRKFTLN